MERLVMQISVMSNIKDVKRKMTKVERKVIPKATSQALNKTLTRAYTFVVRETAKATGMKQKDLRQLVSKNKASARHQEALIIIRGNAPNLIRFNARQNKAGVSATSWGNRKTYEGAFIANSGRTVFARTSDKRLPIKALHGARPPREVVRQKIDEATAVFGIKQFQTEFARAVNLQLARMAK
jgi:hypothetical protein